MGKRKIHNQTYFQCDWTGLPMRSTNCYMPNWSDTGKLLKHGSYCCWEAVIADATEQYSAHEINDERYQRICEHVNELTGTVVQAAPHWGRLAWFAREQGKDVIHNGEHFLHLCCSLDTSPIMAVRMTADGTTSEVLCDQNTILAKFAGHLTRPFTVAPEQTPHSFQTMRKKSNKERDLTIFYWPYKNGLMLNETATNLFKMQIYGDVLIVQQSKEPCFIPRERYCSYFQSLFNEQFTTKKRKDNPTTLSTDDYEVAKAQMASELRQVEALASSEAALPGELAKASNLPPPSGQELADLLRARGQPPPRKTPKLLDAPPVAAQVH